jgi:hypothetical protein
VQDLYFDDENWAVRYLVADTGTWLPGRKVLLSPHAIGDLDAAGKVLGVKLTRKQVEDSPPMASHQPVSRQYEAEYYRYYGWPYYWEGGGLWGLSGFPILELPVDPARRDEKQAAGGLVARADSHLRSTTAVTGYRLQASDGTMGHVSGFMVDDRSWAIGQLVVKTGHRLSGKEVDIPTSQVERISYEESAVFVRLTMDAVEHGLAHRPAAEVA